MYLLIDIGNSRLKWCLLDELDLTVPTALRCIDAWYAELQTAWLALPRPQGVRVASVAASAINLEVAALVWRLWNLDPVFARPRQLVHGLVIAYADPSSLGVDRWLAMLAARHRSLSPALVVDCGTAVTIDALDIEGKHLGGLIVPGLNLLWNAIFEGTNVATVAFPETFDLLGRDTNECVASGTLQAIVGLIESIQIRLSTQGNRPHLVLTGGDADKVARRLTSPYALIPELVLEGLALLAD